jgi:hypothetical protein
MVHATQRKSKVGTIRTGTTALSVRGAARLLGCNHGHLSRVLRGERESRSLMRRYQALKVTK